MKKQQVFSSALLIFIFFSFVHKSFTQPAGPSSLNPDHLMNVSEVVIQWDSIMPPPDVQKSLSPKILKALNIFPNTVVSTFELDLAQSLVEALPDVGKVNWNIEMLSGNDIRLILLIRVSDKIKKGYVKSGLLLTGDTKEFPNLFKNKKSFLKFNLSGNLTPTLITNTWWGNGKTFTQYNPFGNDPPGIEPSLDMEAYFLTGLSGITRISNGKIPLYAFGSFNVLGVTTLGNELYNANSNTFKFQMEEAYAGIVGANTTKEGHLLRFMFSFGMQPYKIGNGMLICQIAGNGGTWAGMNAWPRFSGELVGLAKFAYDNWRFEGFYIQPHEYVNNQSYTKILGLNAEYNKSKGLSGGFTYLNIPESEFPYFFPDYSQTTRKGLNAMNLRLQWVPGSDESFLFIKTEGGLQLNGKIPMRAYGMALEGGLNFGNVDLRPSVSYRYSLLSGDDPNTSRYERWDILYSGDDIVTWVQGPLMKNILFNSNLETSRFQIQLFPIGWRLTAQYSFFMANQLNTVPSPPVGAFSDEQIGQELSIIAERYVSRNIYVRLMATSLWAGKGIADVLPDPVSTPWTELIALFKFSF